MDRGDSVYLLDRETGKFAALLSSPFGRFTCLAFAPDGQSLATGGADGTVLVWQLGGPNPVAYTHADEWAARENRAPDREVRRSPQPRPTSGSACGRTRSGTFSAKRSP